MEIERYCEDCQAVFDILRPPPTYTIHLQKSEKAQKHTDVHINYFNHFLSLSLFLLGLFKLHTSSTESRKSKGETSNEIQKENPQSAPAVAQLNSTVHRCSQEDTQFCLCQGTVPNNPYENNTKWILFHWPLYIYLKLYFFYVNSNNFVN